MPVTGGNYHVLAPRNKREARHRLIIMVFGSVAAAGRYCGVNHSLISRLIALERRSRPTETKILNAIEKKLGHRAADLWAA